jgi:hypothetical protein
MAHSSKSPSQRAALSRQYLVNVCCHSRLNLPPTVVKLNAHPTQNIELNKPSFVRCFITVSEAAPLKYARVFVTLTLGNRHDRNAQSDTKVAKHLDVSRVALSRVLNEQAAISTVMSLKLDKALGTSADFWFKMQTNHDF